MADFSLIDAHEIKAMLSALFGGFLSKRFRRGMSIRVWIFTALSIVGMAYIFAVPIAVYFGNIGTAAVVGCLIGMFGIPICEMIADNIPKIDLAGIVKSRLGGE